MSIASLKLDESAKLEFDVLITGADGVPNARFVIEGKDFSVSYPCRQVNEGIEVDVGGLKNVLPAGEYPVRLEIVLENKIYTPMQDTIKLEPIVEINTKTKPAAQIKESVKVLGKVNVTKKAVITEEMQRQIQVAADVAAVLHYTPSIDMSPAQIIESALRTVDELPREELVKLEKLLVTAETCNVQFDRDLTPTLLEAKKEEDDEDDKKEVLDTADYKVTPSGKKARAHKVVFNKGEEEKPKIDEVNNMDKEEEKEMSEKRVNAFARFMNKHGQKSVMKESMMEKALVEDIELIDSLTEEQLDEILKKSDPASKWISDFVKSKNPKFSSDTKKQRIKRALGAYYSAQRNEEVEIDEQLGMGMGLGKRMGWCPTAKPVKMEEKSMGVQKPKVNTSPSARDLVRKTLARK